MRRGSSTTVTVVDVCYSKAAKRFPTWFMYLLIYHGRCTRHNSIQTLVCWIARCLSRPLIQAMPTQFIYICFSCWCAVHSLIPSCLFCNFVKQLISVRTFHDLTRKSNKSAISLRILWPFICSALSVDTTYFKYSCIWNVFVRVTDDFVSIESVRLSRVQWINGTTNDFSVVRLMITISWTWNRCLKSNEMPWYEMDNIS